MFGLVYKWVFWFYGCIFCLNQAMYGQSALSFTHLTVENGLSNSSVLCIEQDAKGFIWLGTRDGLNRYDGSRMKVYKDFYKNNFIGPNLRVHQLKADEQQNLWIGTNNGLYLYNLQDGLFSSFFHAASDLSSISNNTIKSIFIDSRKNIWVGTEKGLNKIIKKNGNYKFQKIPLEYSADDSSFNFVQAISETSGGRILIGTTKGLFSITQGSNSAKKAKALGVVNIFSITQDYQKNIWLGSSESGLYKTDSALKTVTHFLHSKNSGNRLLHNNIRKLMIDKNGFLWIATLKGLNILNPANNKFQSFYHIPEDASTLNYNSIYDIFQDRQGSVWLATYFGGVNIVEAISPKFKVYQNTLNSTSISSNIISAIVEDENDNLWVGTEAEGLNKFIKKQNRFVRFKNEEGNAKSLGANLVKTILKDSRNCIWAGTYSGGLNLLTPNGFKRYTKDNGLKSNDITALIEDKAGKIWIGHQEYGINIFDVVKNNITTFEKQYPACKLKEKAITCLFRDSKNNIWMGTRTGLNRLSFLNQNSHPEISSNFREPLNKEYINCITEDKAGNILIGSYSGFSIYNPNTKMIKTFTPNDGLPGNKVMGIVPDDNNIVWLSTNNGMARFNMSHNQFTIYNHYDGLPGENFNYNSAYKSKNGNIFFGNYNGLIEFSPKEIKLNKTLPSIVLTGLAANGKTINTNDSTGILSKNISETNSVKLHYDQNDLVIDYAILNFIKPQKNASAYMLEGYDRSWIYNTHHSATFINLAPGNYMLRIKGSNNDGLWSQPVDILKITIFPPPWKTWWAYTGYSLAFVLLTGGIFYFLNSRAALKRNLEYEHAINAKQRELQEMKTKFFTHISHEIRTPLTLILGPAEILMENKHQSAAEKKLLSSIKSNADRILKLTNNLMDFIKAESGYIKLDISKNDIVNFSRPVFDSFSIAAKEKSIDCDFFSSEDNIDLYFDPYYMEIVLYNLLSNAIKFTPKAGKMKVEIVEGENEVQISVCDSGAGIPAESGGKIFTQYFQIDSKGNKKTGTGIGLALSKLLVEMHKGTIDFKSNRHSANNDYNTCFYVSLKKGKSHFNDAGEAPA